MNIKEVISLMRQKGFKITPQRRAIFNILGQAANHPKAEEVFEELRRSMPDVSLTTVYNTLNELSVLGVIDVVRDVGGSSTRYDPITENHDHLFCLVCQRITDIEKENTDQTISDEKKQGYQVIKQQVTYFGYCPECQKMRETESI